LRSLHSFIFRGAMGQENWLVAPPKKKKRTWTVLCVFLTLLLITWPQWTSTHQRTIHWMPIITQLWMNLNWVNIWFHLGNQFWNE
jgi:hypothetical protein